MDEEVMYAANFILTLYCTPVKSLTNQITKPYSSACTLPALTCILPAERMPKDTSPKKPMHMTVSVIFLISTTYDVSLA